MVNKMIRQSIKRWSWLFIWVSLIALMTSCAPEQKTVYQYSPPTSPQGRACVDECKQAHNVCESLCVKESPQCIYEAQQKAQTAFHEYEMNQQAMGKPVSLTPESFYNDTQCAHTGCGCAQEYSICYQLCGTRTEIRAPRATD